jgi:hypothetical protein
MSADDSRAAAHGRGRAGNLLSEQVASNTRGLREPQTPPVWSIPVSDSNTTGFENQPAIGWYPVAVRLLQIVQVDSIVHQERQAEEAG